MKSGSEVTSSQRGGAVKGGQEKPFESMNNIVANLLLNLTRWVASPTGVF